MKTQIEALKETQASIRRQMEFNISRRRSREADRMTRGIGNSDNLLASTIGVDRAAGIVAKMVESIKPTMAEGFDPLAGDANPFSFRNLYEACCEMEDKGVLREAGAESTYGALLRLGVTNIVGKAWKEVPRVWDKVLMTVASKGLYGVYGSTFMQSMPQFVGAGQEFPEVSVDPMGNIVPNVKWGDILAFQSEAIDDDMTGELVQKAGENGEAMGRVNELAFAAYLSDATLTEGNLSITPATYTDPDNTTGVYKSTGLRQNRPTSFGAISMLTLKFARQTLKNIKQPNGIRIMVNPNSIVYHPDDEQIINTLLGSPVWPGSFSSADSAAPIAGTTTGAPGAVNPLKQYNYTAFECRYLNAVGSNGGAWFLGQRQSRSLIYQNRDGLQILQESPNAGKSFDLDENRWRARMRGNWAWILGGPRFWFQGNDGN